VRVASLIDPADRLRIEACVLEAERESSAEIVVAVMRACDAYGSPGWRLGVLLALLAYASLAVWLPGTPPSALLAAQAAALWLGHRLAQLDPIRRQLISEDLVDARVAERAQRTFAECGLMRSPGRTGVLVFVAVLERRVLVLADEGIPRELAAPQSLDEVVALATEGLRGGRAADGLVAAVNRLGEMLSRQLPAAPRRFAELPSALVLGE
jgi:putative membrane protein